MEQAESQSIADRHARPDFSILVNERPVLVHESRMTGFAIKKAAIKQGVPIQLDFVLSEEQSHGRPKIIGDEDIVTVNKHSKFHAVSPDDNS